MTRWPLTNNHKLGKKFHHTSFVESILIFLPPSPHPPLTHTHTHTYVSHLDVHLRCRTGLIKHSLSDCLLCRRFGSVWPRPLWPGLILNILHREITRGRRDRDEEGRGGEEGGQENGLRLQKQADIERGGAGAAVHPSVVLLLPLLPASISQSHSPPTFLFLFFLSLPCLLSSSSSLPLSH